MIVLPNGVSRDLVPVGQRRVEPDGETAARIGPAFQWTRYKAVELNPAGNE